jgi:hypothetical protein
MSLSFSVVACLAPNSSYANANSNRRMTPQPLPRTPPAPRSHLRASPPSTRGHCSRWSRRLRRGSGREQDTRSCHTDRPGALRTRAHRHTPHPRKTVCGRLQLLRVSECSQHLRATKRTHFMSNVRAGSNTTDTSGGKHSGGVTLLFLLLVGGMTRRSIVVSLVSLGVSKQCALVLPVRRA